LAESNDKLDLKAVVAMGVGGMVGGGIFSVLGLAMGISGHAAPIVFAIGGVIALFTGRSYAQWGVVVRSAGGSFTYIEHEAAFRYPKMSQARFRSAPGPRRSGTRRRRRRSRGNRNA
jgi:L-asparagine transporter-like permease